MTLILEDGENGGSLLLQMLKSSNPNRSCITRDHTLGQDIPNTSADATVLSYSIRNRRTKQI